MEDHGGVTRNIGVPWTNKDVPVDRLLQWAICGVRGLSGGPDINTGNNNNNNNNKLLNGVSGLVGGPETSTTTFGGGSSSSSSNNNNNNNCNNDYNSVSYLNHFYQGSLRRLLFEFKHQSVFFYNKHTHNF